MAAPVRLVSPPSRARRNLTPQDARALLEEFPTSGVSAPKFARGKGISPQCLSYWSKKLGIPLRSAAPSPFPAFLPVQIASSATVPARRGFELDLRAGRTLRVPADFEHTALVRLVTALQEVGAW